MPRSVCFCCRLAWLGVTSKWYKVFKSGLSKFQKRQPLKNLLSPFLNTLSQISLLILSEFEQIVSTALLKSSKGHKFSVDFRENNFIKKETRAQVFSCEFCEIFKNTIFTEHLRTTASVHDSHQLSVILSISREGENKHIQNQRLCLKYFTKTLHKNVVL